jgi:hypothetical protein
MPAACGRGQQAQLPAHPLPGSVMPIPQRFLGQTFLVRSYSMIQVRMLIFETLRR